MSATSATLRALGAFCIFFVLVQPASAVSRTENAVYQMAQQCYAIRSAGNGKYLQNRNGVFRFATNDINHAEKFFMKPARLGDFLMTDRGGRYLNSVVPFVENPVSNPSLAAEWDISAREVSSNRFEFRFRNRLTGAPIQYEWVKRHKHTFWWWTWYTYEPRLEQHFQVVRRNDCRPYPEIASGVTGDRSRLKGNVNSPVRGFVDAHSHLTSYEFMGGKVVHGAPFHKYGVPYALSDAKESHGPNGQLDIIGKLQVHGDPAFTYDTRGWPHFPYWPGAHAKTHTGYYWTWLERAWLSGQRILVVQLVENQVLCLAQSTLNPIGWLPHNSCDTMDSIRLQAKRVRQMENYIDAQYGGPGKGFFRVVTSPQQARQVIADGKLAVVMGVEASETLNCGVRDYCSISKIEQGLNELYNLGIRSIFPTHKSDNQFGGAVLADGFVNVGQALATGHYFETKRCDDRTRGRKMTSGLPVIGEVPVVQDLLAQIGASPSYEDHNDHCNRHGITPFGVYLVNRMIDKNMIIDLDHLGSDTTNQVMAIAKARNYSGLVSSHSFMHSNKQGGTHDNTQDMLNLGGFIATYIQGADGGGYARDLAAVKKTPYLRAVGLGTDTSGLAAQPGPRGSAASSPMQYPFYNEFGFRFDRQRSGHRVFDVNNEGLAHYGLLADLINDTRERQSAEVYEALMNSAEGYLQMWERAEANNTSGHVNPL